jgi:hypothetical protein
VTAALRRALDRLATGAPIVLWRIAHWPSEGKGWWILGRSGWLAFCSWSSWQMVQHSRPTMAMLTGWLLAAGWRAGGAAAPSAEAAPEPDGEDDDAKKIEPVATPEQVRAYVLPIIYAKMGDRKAVHLDTLRDALIDRGIVPAGHRITTLRQELEQVGIPVRDQVHRDRVTRAGINRDDLAAAGLTPSAPSPPASSNAA